MSYTSRPAQPLEVRERATCMCATGSPCSSFAPGHAVHLIQARLASATPSDWVDAIVEDVDAPTGTLVVRGLLDGLRRELWNGRGAAGQVGVGEPIALHERYHTLAVGSRWFNVLALD